MRGGCGVCVVFFFVLWSFAVISGSQKVRGENQPFANSWVGGLSW
ncbi:hypothetical protein OURE66S_03353 [Oligella ureolytica]